MTPHDDDRMDEVTAGLLRATRPEPREDWVHATEARLVGRSARAGRRVTALVGALGLSGALAGVFATASLLGGGPLTLDGQQDVRAKQDCRTVDVTRTQKAGQLVEQPDGTTTVVNRDRTVTTPVRRCR